MPVGLCGEAISQATMKARATDARHRVTVLFRAATAVLVPVLSAGLVSAAWASSFRGLGDLPGGEVGSEAHAISADGSVIVGFSESSSGSEAFRVTIGDPNGMVGLGVLPGGGVESEAYGVSADGSVVVGGSRSASSWEAFRWTPDGGMVGLGFLANGSFSVAYAASADGSVIVGYSSTESLFDGESFRWTSSHGMVGLGFLPHPGEYRESGASSVSADGFVVVGTSWDDTPITEAYHWTPGGGMIGLGDLPGGIYLSSQAVAVSSDGSVVVGMGQSTSGFEAFRWTEAGGMVGLGDLPAGDFSSAAIGVSADGSIVVGRGVSGSGEEAFIWDSANGIQNLKDVLVGDYGLDLTGWTLKSAQDVSDDGLMIVGYGDDPNGNTQGWLADLSSSPEAVPAISRAHLALFASLLGMLALGLVRRNSTKEL